MPPSAAPFVRLPFVTAVWAKDFHFSRSVQRNAFMLAEMQIRFQAMLPDGYAQLTCFFHFRPPVVMDRATLSAASFKAASASSQVYPLK